MFPWAAGRGGWRRNRLCLIFLLVGACWNGAGAVLVGMATGAPPSQDFASAALRSLLQSSATDGANCSVVIFADNSVTAKAIIRDSSTYVFAAGGTTLMQLPATEARDGGAGNSTAAALNEPLRHLMKMARRLRIINRCISMLFVTDSGDILKEMLQHSTDDRLMRWSTHGIIVTSMPQASVLAVAEGKWAFTMMNTHLLLLRRSAAGNSALVLRHEPYSPEGPRTSMVGYFTLARGLSHTAPLHYEKFRNFFNADVNYTSLPFAPLWDEKIEILPNGTKKYVYSGINQNMLDLFSTKLNFNPTYLRPRNWDEVVSLVQKRDSFYVACEMFMFSHRLEKTDFVSPMIMDDLAFAMRLPSTASGWDSFLRPFHLEVWISTLVLVLVVSFCFVLVLKFSEAPNVVSSKLRGGMQVTGKAHNLSKSRAILEVFGALLGQDFTMRMPHTHAFRLLTTAYFIFVIVLSTGYKSNLISFMTLPKVPHRIETLKELVDSNIMISAQASYGRDVQKAVSLSSSAELKILARRYVFNPSAHAGLEASRTQQVAHTEGRIFLKYKIAEFYTRQDGFSDLYIGKESMMTFIISFVVPHDAPYKPQLDRLLLYAVQAGLYRKWYDTETENLKIKKAREARENPDADGSSGGGVKPLTLYQTQGPFWILICGSLLSITCFVAELCAWRLIRACGGAPQPDKP